LFAALQVHHARTQLVLLVAGPRVAALPGEWTVAREPKTILENKLGLSDTALK